MLWSFICNNHGHVVVHLRRWDKCKLKQPLDAQGKGRLFPVLCRQALNSSPSWLTKMETTATNISLREMCSEGINCSFLKIYHSWSGVGDSAIGNHQIPSSEKAPHPHAAAPSKIPLLCSLRRQKVRPADFCSGIEGISMCPMSFAVFVINAAINGVDSGDAVLVFASSPLYH